MKQPELITHTCPVCRAAYQALPGSKVTCPHGGRPEYRRPVAVALPDPQLTLEGATT